MGSEAKFAALLHQPTGSRIKFFVFLLIVTVHSRILNLTLAGDACPGWPSHLKLISVCQCHEYWRVFVKPRCHSKIYQNPAIRHVHCPITPLPFLPFPSRSPALENSTCCNLCPCNRARSSSTASLPRPRSFVLGTSGVSGGTGCTGGAAAASAPLGRRPRRRSRSAL